MVNFPSILLLSTLLVVSATAHGKSSDPETYLQQPGLESTLYYMMQDPKFYDILARSMQEYQTEQESPAAADDMIYRTPMSKRNSELLNSLLGLPKNILKSGRR